MPTRFLQLFLPLFILTLLAACDVNVKAGSFEDDKAHALMRVQEFRKLVDARDFAALYELGGPAMKSTLTKEQFVESARTSAANMGAYRSAQLMGSSCFPNEVRLVYHSEFERGKVTEWMVWSVPKDEAFLQMYRVMPGHAEMSSDAQKNCPV